jgi:F-type H+-transporting ATPase subunit b
LRYSILHSRFSARILWLALFAVLTAGVAITPLRSTAQGSAPTTQSAPAPTAQTPAQPQAAQSAPAAGTKETKEENNDKFRHTALVQAVAKMLHISVEAMAETFEYINFTILFLCVAIPLGRFLPKVLRKRGQTVSHNIEEARKATEGANARLGVVEAKLSKLDDEIALIRSQVEQESVQDEVHIKANLEEERARIVAASEQEIDVAAAQAKRGLRDYATELAIEQASKQLILTPETDRALIAEFVGDAAKKGQN